MKIRLVAAVAALVACLNAIPASATTLSLDTGKSLVLNQSQSGSMTFTFTNNPGDITDNFLGWVMGIQVLPAGAVSGTVTLGTLTQSVVNPVPIGASPDVIQPTFQTLGGSGTINGTTGFYQIGMQTTVGLGTVVGSTSYNMGDLGFTASGDALGTWNVYAVQQNTPFFQTFWLDGVGTEIDYGNLPRTAGNSSVLLGTVTAVPEPGSLAVAGVAGMMAMGCVWGRRRKAKARAAAAASISA